MEAGGQDNAKVSLSLVGKLIGPKGHADIQTVALEVEANVERKMQAN